MLVRILAALAVVELCALAVMSGVHRAEPVQTLPLIHAQLSICKPLGPPPAPDADSDDKQPSQTPAPDYQPRDTGHIA